MLFLCPIFTVMNPGNSFLFGPGLGPCHSVVPFEQGDRLLPLDLSAGNPALSDALLSDRPAFESYIMDTARQAGARYAIGGYAEHRSVYRISPVFDGEAAGEEPRRLHLGTDIWGPAHTPVMAPLDATVHSFAYNNRPGDYGTTIILSHHVNGRFFYSLYGHLNLAALSSVVEGQPIYAGQAFAAFGIPEENGGWPPHLHLQLILDIGDNRGDFPGVCRFSEKEKWLANSPDPDIILNMNRYIL